MIGQEDNIPASTVGAFKIFRASHYNEEFGNTIMKSANYFLLDKSAPEVDIKIPENTPCRQIIWANINLLNQSYLKNAIYGSYFNRGGFFVSTKKCPHYILKFLNETKFI